MNDETTPTRPERTGPAVYDAIAAVMLYMSQEGISKDRQSGDGGGAKFKFRGIDDIYNALSSVMAANRLMMLPRMVDRTQVERTTKSGGAIFYTVVKGEFDLVSAEDGSKHTVSTFGEAMDSSDKSTNKAMSAAFKYAAMQAFCIPTEGDNDADAASHDVAPRERQQDNRQSGGQARGGSGQARNGNDEQPKMSEAEVYLRNNLLPQLRALLDNKESGPNDVTALLEREANGIARLKKDYVPLFREWDHELGKAVAIIDDVPF